MIERKNNNQKKCLQLVNLCVGKGTIVSEIKSVDRKQV